jgi:hypothetical protein
MGKPWTDEEVVQLLASIKKKKSIEDIAAEHQRTVGGINGQRKRLAIDYYFNDDRTIEQIGKFTGLTEEQIKDAISKQGVPAKKKLVIVNEPKVERPNETVVILKDIRDKLMEMRDTLDLLIKITDA